MSLESEYVEECVNVMGFFFEGWELGLGRVGKGRAHIECLPGLT